jgi:hypothetical protein
MSLTHYDRAFLVPPPRRGKPAPRLQEEHGIGRSPRFMPGWWLAGTAIFYVAVALICILVL